MGRYATASKAVTNVEEIPPDEVSSKNYYLVSQRNITKTVSTTYIFIFNYIIVSVDTHFIITSSQMCIMVDWLLQ